MSITHYQTLQQQTVKKPELLGIVLPVLTPGSVDIQCSTKSAEEMSKQVAQFQAITGWVLYRDRLVLTEQIPGNHGVIEAEYSDGKNTLMIRYIGDETYRITEFRQTEEQSENMVYKDQRLFLRNNIAPGQTATYRLWYQQDNSESDLTHQGRWTVVAQQFISINPAEGVA